MLAIEMIFRFDLLSTKPEGSTASETKLYRSVVPFVSSFNSSPIALKNGKRYSGFNNEVFNTYPLGQGLIYRKPSRLSIMINMWKLRVV